MPFDFYELVRNALQVRRATVNGQPHDFQVWCLIRNHLRVSTIECRAKHFLSSQLRDIKIAGVRRDLLWQQTHISQEAE